MSLVYLSRYKVTNRNNWKSKKNKYIIGYVIMVPVVLTTKNR